MNMPTIPDRDHINLFANALQLSIQSRIVSVALTSTQPPALCITLEALKNDDHWQMFQKMVGGGFWNKPDREWFIPDVMQTITDDMINFLQLSRLVPENMRALAAMDARYRPFLVRAGLEIAPAHGIAISDLHQAVQLIFDAIRKKGLTLRRVSESSGLSAMTLHKIKNGSDMRLSSFLRLCQSVGLTLHLE